MKDLILSSSKLILPFTILVLLVLILSFIFIKYKKYSHNPILDQKDKIFISLLAIIYFAISLIHFGQINKFGSWQINNINQSLTINFNHPTNINSVYYYYGLGDGNLQLEYLTANNKSGFVNFNNNLAIYKWMNITIPANDNTNITKLIIRPTKLNLDLKQLAFLDNNKNLLTNFTATSTDLNKEQIDSLFSKVKPLNMDNTFLSSMYFDEIYYARTAYEYFHKMEPFTWVHPPLGMLLIGLGILLFGMNTVGWRIVPDISGVILLVVMYVFAKKVFKSRIAAIFSSLLLALDFMHFSLSRMASIDPFSTLFITLEVLFLFNYVSYKRNNEHNKAIISLTYCGIFFGLAAASKWSGFFTVPLLIICTVFYEIKYSNRSIISILKSIILCLITLVYIPLSIYALSYLPYFSYTTNNNFFNLIYNLQGFMINYHTTGTKFATHPYASNWWSWPLLFKPLSVYYYQNGDQASSVVFMGSPAIWWTGCITALITLINAIRLKQYTAWFITLAIASLYLPWALSERLSFIYYFYSVIPFWILSITYVFHNYNLKAKYYIMYLCLALFLFIMFYPAISGILFSRSYVAQDLLWFKSWLF